MWKKFQEVPLLVAAVGFSIVVNVFQFLPIENSIAKKENGTINPGRTHHLALYQNKTDDIVLLASELNNVQDTHNLFLALRNYPSDTVYVSLSSDLNDKHTFSAAAYGVSMVNTIKYVSFPASVLNFGMQMDVSDHIVMRGELWEQPGHARAGLPGRTWAIASHQDNVKRDFVVIDDFHGLDYLLLDTRLLPNDIRQELVR